MRKKLTEIVFILDRSGSMSGLEADTIGGFNSLIDEQKAGEGECIVSTVLFDNYSELLYDRVRLENVPKMTRRDYIPRGGTALYDAIGAQIERIGCIHKYARRENVPAHTLFVIITDGAENSSRQYDLRKIRELIERQKRRFDWEFLFIGANIDAQRTADSFGIGADRAANYHADDIGTRTVFRGVARAVESVRRDEQLDGGWSMDIRKDFSSRGAKR